ncbi:5-hydroxytryptamine receptor 3A-like [Mercenaria mercenaria]|uniref:5-hydroxytryptamine receptor 3A-like n=1 Tax=Mercenaria mercenaria TaxID=6596 RepID=UPI00234F8DFE|nr:5-hydroxytryptamine receptor 3A-like [Mercenaria mercenaria]
MLLAISVYMTIVSDHLPQNSQPMPIISGLMFIWYILDALIVFAVIINSKINTTRDTKKLSYVSKKFVIITRKLTCHGYKKQTNKTLFGQSENYIDEETANQTDNTDGENPLDSNEKVDSDAITWQELSHSIDKWCFKKWHSFATFVLTILFSLSWANTDLKPDMLEMKALSDELLKNYSKYILPSKQRPFSVTIYVRLRSMGDIDEIDQMLSKDTVVYDSEGRAYFDEMMKTRTTCNLDMTFYPFDIQSCNIDVHVFIVGHLYYWFNLNISVYKDFSVDEANHGSWTLINKNVSENGNGAFKVQLKFKRRPLFIPLFFCVADSWLALLIPVVFVLPKKSGERVGYTITMLLAISVYMTIVSDHLPMPIISV